MTTFARRFIGAAMLDAPTYEEVEADRSATPQALAVVLISSLAAGIGLKGADGGVAAVAFFATASVIGLLAWAAFALLALQIGARLLPTADTRVDAAQLLRRSALRQRRDSSRSLACCRVRRRRCSWSPGSGPSLPASSPFDRPPTIQAPPGPRRSARWAGRCRSWWRLSLVWSSVRRSRAFEVSSCRLDLTTTNALLGILAAVSVLEGIAVLGVFLGAALVYRRLMKTIDGIESRHVAPASVRVNAILDDIKSVTSTVKGETSRMNQLLDWILDAIGRRRERRDETRPTHVM